MLNFATFLFFFVREGKRKTFGDWVKYLICVDRHHHPGVRVHRIPDATYIVGVCWLVVGLIIGAVKSKGYKEVPEAFKHLEV